MLIQAVLPPGVFDFKRFFEDYPTAEIVTHENDNNDGNDEDVTTYIQYDGGKEYGNYKRGGGYGEVGCLADYLNNWVNPNPEYRSEYSKLVRLPAEVKQALKDCLNTPTIAAALKKEKEIEKYNKSLIKTQENAERDFKNLLRNYIKD